MEPSNSMKNIMKDKSLSMEQKLVSFLALTDPKMLPDNPNYVSHDDVGEKILNLVKSGTISLGKFDENFKLNVNIL